MRKVSSLAKLAPTLPYVSNNRASQNAVLKLKFAVHTSMKHWTGGSSCSKMSLPAERSEI